MDFAAKKGVLKKFEVKSGRILTETEMYTSGG
jgi:hypothetical protein